MAVQIHAAAMGEGTATIGRGPMSEGRRGLDMPNWPLALAVTRAAHPDAGPGVGRARAVAPVVPSAARLLLLLGQPGVPSPLLRHTICQHPSLPRPLIASRLCLPRLARGLHGNASAPEGGPREAGG